MRKNSRQSYLTSKRSSTTRTGAIARTRASESEILRSKIEEQDSEIRSERSEDLFLFAPLRGTDALRAFGFDPSLRSP